MIHGTHIDDARIALIVRAVVMVGWSENVLLSFLLINI